MGQPTNTQPSPSGVHARDLEKKPRVGYQEGMSLRWLMVMGALAALSGCNQGGGQAPGPSNPPAGGGVAGAVASDLPGAVPPMLLAGPGTGPALYLGANPNDPPVGYISPDTSFEVAGALGGERVAVRINGPMTVEGLYFTSNRLAARVLRGGRVRGTPVSVGVGNVVRVLGPADEERRTRIAVTPVVADPRLREGLGTWEGTFPVVGLGTVASEAAETLPEGSARRLPAAEVGLYDAPGGALVYTLPALNPGLTVELVRDEGPWQAVRVGSGPYLIGFVQTNLVPAAATMLPASGAGRSGAALPQRISDEGAHPLFRVPAGTEVVFEGRVIARLNQAGWAREMRRYAAYEQSDVFVAVDDSVAVRGLVRVSALQPATP